VVRDDLVVAHQWHEKVPPPNRRALWMRNRDLYQDKFGVEVTEPPPRR
jgi:hypothetical protein